MKISTINKTISFLMVILILVSSSGFSMSIHYCHGKAKNISFYTDALNCITNPSKILQNKSCNLYKIIESKNCCSNKSFQIKKDITDKVLKKHSKVQFNKKYLNALIFTIVLTREDSFKPNINFLNYSPPPLVKYFPVFNQSFII
jgi:hypothetical protein